MRNHKEKSFNGVERTYLVVLPGFNLSVIRQLNYETQFSNCGLF